MDGQTDRSSVNKEANEQTPYRQKLVVLKFNFFHAGSMQAVKLDDLSKNLFVNICKTNISYSLFHICHICQKCQIEVLLKRPHLQKTSVHSSERNTNN